MRIYRKYLPLLFILGLLCNLALAREYPPGEDEGYWMHYIYNITVTDEYTNPLNAIDVRMMAQYYLAGEPYYEYQTGATNIAGQVTLEIWVDITGHEGEYYFSRLIAEIIEPGYTVLSAQGTPCFYPTGSASFEIVYDLDGDLVDDNVEWQLANKFKPVLHSHSLGQGFIEKQQGLQNMDLIINSYGSLKVVLTASGQTAYNNSTPPIHVIDTNGYWDTYAIGTNSIISILDISDSQRYLSAPAGQRPLYFHCYKEGNYYYLQYWYFFTMNDIQDQTNYNIYHEGDWEHVSIKIEKSGENFIPKYVNFYQHAGGHTINANNCWWSPTSATAYSGIQEGYDENHTHLHIWIAANSHASYNRIDMRRYIKFIRIYPHLVMKIISIV